ncbi:MAG: hypothetical protein WA687_13925 [Solirubrobacterales bacterium]
MLRSHQQKSAIERTGELAKNLRAVLAVDDCADVPLVDVICQISGIDRLTGQQPPHAFELACAGWAPLAASLLRVLRSRRHENSLEQNRLAMQYAANPHVPWRDTPVGRLEDEIAERGIAGKVAAQHNLKRGASQRQLLRNGEKVGRNGTRAILPVLDAGKTMIHAGGNGSGQAEYITVRSIRVIKRVRHTNDDRLLYLKPVSLQARAYTCASFFRVPHSASRSPGAIVKISRLYKGQD